MNYLVMLGSNSLAEMSLFKATFFTSPAITCFVLLLAAIGLLVILWLSYGNVETKMSLVTALTIRWSLFIVGFTAIGSLIGLGFNIVDKAFR